LPRNSTGPAGAAGKVEQAMSKKIAEVAMCSRIGEVFDAIVTGVTSHGTFVHVSKALPTAAEEAHETTPMEKFVADGASYDPGKLSH